MVLSSRPQLSHAVFLSDWSFHSDSATSVNLVYISRASSLSLILQPGATRRTSGTTCGPLEDPSSFSKSFFTFYCLFLNSAKYLDNFLSPLIIYFRLCHFPGYSENFLSLFYFLFYCSEARIYSVRWYSRLTGVLLRPRLLLRLSCLDLCLCYFISLNPGLILGTMACG